MFLRVRGLLVLGQVMVRQPLVWSAVILVSSTSAGRRKERVQVPEGGQ